MKKFLLSLIFFLILLEVGLRVTGVFKVYSEKLGQNYFSYWNYEHYGHFMILPLSQRINYVQPEFEIDFMSNKYGMRNIEIDDKSPIDTKRILCFGDSFTEGDGARFGFSYPRILENILNDRFDSSYQVVNAGKNGSDIIYAERVFMDHFYNLNPSLVIFALNDSDIDDITQRGGLERFKENKITKFKNGPKDETLYAKLHVYRFISHVLLGRTSLLLSKKKQKSEAIIANEIIQGSMQRLIEFGKQKDIEVVFMLHPLPGHVKMNQTQLLKSTQLDEAQLLATDGGVVYSVNEPLLKRFRSLNYDDYAWKINGHYNEKGYQILADEFYNVLEANNIVGK